MAYRGALPPRSSVGTRVHVFVLTAWLALFGHFLWLVGTYVISWGALTLRERE